MFTAGTAEPHTSMNRIFLSPPHQNGLELGKIQEVLDSNYLAPVGPMLGNLEAKMCEVLGLPHAVALSSGTAALQLAYHHLLSRFRPQTPAPPVVIGCSLSFIASVAPAAQLGCEIWLVDAEEGSWTIDPIHLNNALLEAAAEQRDVLCVVPTDLYGQAADLDAVHGLCDPKGIPVICDSAEALGVVRHGANPRTQVISFNGNKILTSGGGGVLASEDLNLIQHALKLSTQAREPVAHYEHTELGYNLRMGNLTAAVAVAQLQSLPERVQRRREIFSRYHQNLGDLPGVTFMPEASWNTASRWLTVLRIDSRVAGVDPESVRLALEAENIESRPMWKPLHQQPVFRGIRMFGSGVADVLFEEGLCLPSGTALTDPDLDRISGIISQTLAGSP